MPHRYVNIPLPPTSKGTVSISVKGGRPVSYRKSEKRTFETMIRDYMRESFPSPVPDGPVELVIRFHVHRPSRLTWKTRPMPPAPCDRRPDLDNYEKMVVDGMEGVVFRDDGQVFRKISEKVYHEGGDVPHIEVMVCWGEPFCMRRVASLMEDP